LLIKLTPVLDYLFQFWLIQDFPHDSKLLTPGEQAKWLRRLTASQGVTNSPLPFTGKQVWRGILDWKTYAYAILYLCERSVHHIHHFPFNCIIIAIAEPFYALSLFTPTISELFL
jgi:hypothetical protein